VSDAPAEYIDNLLRGIVGIQISITKLTGKWKVSQNRPMADREGVIRNLEQISGEDAAAMAGLVRQQGD
jgi:transcriptional regulator